MHFHRFEHGTNFFVKYAYNPFFANLARSHSPNMAAPSRQITRGREAARVSFSIAVVPVPGPAKKNPGCARRRPNYAKLGDFFISSR